MGFLHDIVLPMNRLCRIWIPFLLLAPSPSLSAQPAAAPESIPGSIPVPADVAAAPADAQVTASGLASKVLAPGNGGEHPVPSDLVKVHYSGWTTDGKMFDSSLAKGAAATFELTKVIPGWTEGLQLMTEGEARRFWIPKKLAYRGAPDKPEGMLVFEVELLEVVKE